MLGACCYFQHDFNSPPVRSRLYSACSTQATSTVRAIGAIAAQFTLVILIAMQLAYTSAACVHRKMAIKVVTHFLEVIDGLLSMPSVGCIPSLVKIGSMTMHIALSLVFTRRWRVRIKLSGPEVDIYLMCFCCTRLCHGHLLSKVFMHWSCRNAL